MPKDSSRPPRRATRRAFLALLCLGAIAFAFQIDRPVREAIVTSQGKGWKKSEAYRFHSTVRKYGDWPWLMLGGGIGLFAAWRFNSREWQRILVGAMIASTLAGIVANASRLTTGRTRPRESPKIEQGFYGPWHDGRLTIGDPAYNSFPSGHTATAFGFAAVIAIARPRFGIIALAGAGVIAWSSLTMRAHHPSDVVVSVILSFFVAGWAWRWMDRHADRTWNKVRQYFVRRP